jgi:hypothetical protein
MEPARRAMPRNAVRRVRKSVISKSGFGPGVSLRKSFRMAFRSKMTEVLLCSVRTRVAFAGVAGGMKNGVLPWKGVRSFWGLVGPSLSQPKEGEGQCD